MPHAPQPCTRCTQRGLHCIPADLTKPGVPCGFCRKSKSRCSWLHRSATEPGAALEPKPKKKNAQKGKPAVHAAPTALPTKRRPATQVNAVAGPSRLPPTSLTGQHTPHPAANPSPASTHAAVHRTGQTSFSPNAAPGLPNISAEPLVMALYSFHTDVTAHLTKHVLTLEDHVSLLKHALTALAAQQLELLKQHALLKSKLRSIQDTIGIDDTIGVDGTFPGISR